MYVKNIRYLIKLQDKIGYKTVTVRKEIKNANTKTV